MIRLAAILLIVLAAGCVGAQGTPVIQTFERPLGGPNGRNTALPGTGVIIIDPEADDPAAVWAQEYYEVQTKVTPDGYRRYVTDAAHRRAVEIMGHEIEVHVAVAYYGADERRRRHREARSLALYEDFEGIGAPEIRRLMRLRRAEALAWIAAHRSEIEARVR